ncbi:MAG: hypothetical protein U1F43_04935 [Myxococcota bacterium]
MQHVPKSQDHTPTETPDERSTSPRERGMTFEEGESERMPKEPSVGTSGGKSGAKGLPEPEPDKITKSSLEKFRTSPARKVDELALLYGGPDAVANALAWSIGADCLTIAEWQREGLERGSWQVGTLEAKKPDVVEALIDLTTKLGEKGFDWTKWFDDAGTIAAALRSDEKLFDTVARISGTSCGDIVNALRPVFLKDRPDIAEGMEGVHTSLLYNTLTDAGQHLKKPVPKVEGVLSGVGPKTLRDAMMAETAPLYVQIYIGKAHTYALEQVARESSAAPLRGYRYEAFFGAHSMATFVKNQPEGDIDLGKHLDDLDTYCVSDKDPEKESLRERSIGREWATQTVDGLEKKTASLARLRELEAKTPPLEIEEDKELKTLQSNNRSYNKGVRELSPEDAHALETARHVLGEKDKSGELTPEEADTLGEYLKTQKAQYAAMYFHEDDDKVELDWKHERREIMWTATVFDPTAASGALAEKTGRV